MVQLYLISSMATNLKLLEDLTKMDLQWKMVFYHKVKKEYYSQKVALFSDSEKVGDTEEKVLNPDEKDPPSVYGFGHTAHIANVLDSLEKGVQPLNNGESAKKALDIILAIYESQKTGKAIDLPNDFSTMQMKGIFQ